MDRQIFYNRAFDSAGPSATTGELAARDAVKLLRKSNLPKDVLKQIWTLSVPPNMQSMSRQSFYLAMSYVAFAQSNPATPLSAEALQQARGNLPIPKLIGFGTSPAMFGSESGRSIGSDLVNMPAVNESAWRINPQDQSKYNQFFTSFRAAEVPRSQVCAFFLKSRLPQNVVDSIFALADMDRSGGLDADEFCMGMHLVVCISKRGQSIPMQMPSELIPPSKRHLVIPSSGEFTGGAASTTPTMPTAAKTNTAANLSVSSAFPTAPLDTPSYVSTSSGVGGAISSSAAASNSAAESLYSSVSANADAQREMAKTMQASRQNMSELSGAMTSDLQQRLEQVKIQTSAQKVALERAAEELRREHLVLQQLVTQTKQEHENVARLEAETKRVREELGSVRVQVDELRATKLKIDEDRKSKYEMLIKSTVELKAASEELERLNAEIARARGERSEIDGASLLLRVQETLSSSLGAITSRQKIASETIAALKQENSLAVRSLDGLSGDSIAAKTESAKSSLFEVAESAATEVSRVVSASSARMSSNQNKKGTFESLPPPRIPAKRIPKTREDPAASSSSKQSIEKPSARPTTNVLPDIKGEETPAVAVSFDAFPSDEAEKTADVGGEGEFDAFPTDDVVADGAGADEFDAFPAEKANGDGVKTTVDDAFDAFPDDDAAQVKSESVDAADEFDAFPADETPAAKPTPPKKPTKSKKPAIVKRNAPPPPPPAAADDSSAFAGGDDFADWDESPDTPGVGGGEWATFS
eukprot:g2831.t1